MNKTDENEGLTDLALLSHDPFVASNEKDTPMARAKQQQIRLTMLLELRLGIECREGESSFAVLDGCHGAFLLFLCQ
jgi:hypothetical protein